ncbi:hypothetical protein [Melissospora conviva]|uniref:hypothetical protein n=1 Tax=Melissospora conviva TaxID=3388432 RepID=UPI003C24F849
MSETPYLTSLIGLAGAVIGALSTLGATWLSDRRKVRREQRDLMLSFLTKALIQQDKVTVMDSKIRLAMTGKRSSIQHLTKAESSEEILVGLYGIMLDAINAERSINGLDKLSLGDVIALFTDSGNRGNVAAAVSRKEA